jgi:Mce-associated membrane protein
VTGAPTGSATGELEQPSQRAGVATLVALIAVLVIALVLAAWFRGEANQLTGSAAASNTALVDVGATAQVSGQMRDAVQRIYSYDFARLDDNERAAQQEITGPFAQEFRQQFALVRQLAPQQQAVVVATVLNVGVKVLDGDRALLVAFIDQQASRGIRAPQLSVAGRLSVTAQRVGGTWKIADVQPF